MLPDVREDVTGDGVGRVFVPEDAVGEAVHQGRETVVELAEGGRLPAGEPLLHLAVPAGRYVLLLHAAPHPLFVPRAPGVVGPGTGV